METAGQVQTVTVTSSTARALPPTLQVHIAQLIIHTLTLQSRPKAGKAASVPDLQLVEGHLRGADWARLLAFKPLVNAGQVEVVVALGADGWIVCMLLIRVSDTEFCPGQWIDKLRGG